MQTNRQRRSLDKTAKLRGDALLKVLGKIAKELVNIKLAIQVQGRKPRRGKSLSIKKNKNKKGKSKGRKGKSKNKKNEGKEKKSRHGNGRKGKKLRGKNKKKKGQNKKTNKARKDKMNKRG